MKRFSIFLLAIFSLIALVGCKAGGGLSTKEQQNIVTVEEFTPHRRKVEFELKINDPKGKLEGRTLVAKLFDEDDNQISSAELKRTFEIRFDLNGGNSAAIDMQKVNFGGRVDKPKNPTRVGHAFDAWYLDGKVYDFSTKPQSNITLVAGWISAEDQSKSDFSDIEYSDRDGLEFTSHTFSNLDGESKYRLEVSVTLIVKGKAKKYIVINKNFETIGVGYSEENPVLIKTVEDFLNIGKVDDGKVYYRLENDLDFSEVKNSEYIHLFERRKFQGTFDGNNKTIKNFVINSKNTNLYLTGITSGSPANVGLFPDNAGVIKNLNIDNALIDIIQRSVFPKEVNIGLIAGQNNGEIDNVTITNSTIKTKFVFTGPIHVGAIAGKNESKSIISNANVDIELDIDSTSRSEFHIGGIVGHVDDAKVLDSTVNVKVELKNADSLNLGGAVGYLYDSTVERVAVKSNMEIASNITNISSKEIIHLAIGGAIGQQYDANVTDLYVESNILVSRSVNKATTQSDVDRLYVGGAIGKDLSSKTKNLLVQTIIHVGDEEDNQSFDAIDIIYVGGVVGQQYLSTHNQVIAKGAYITVDTLPAATYFISPTSGTDALNTNIRYVDALLIVDKNIYLVQAVKITYNLIEVTEPSEPVEPTEGEGTVVPTENEGTVVPTENEGTVVPTEGEETPVEPTEVGPEYDKVVETTDLNTKAAIFEGFFEEDSFVMEHLNESEFSGPTIP